MNCDQLFNSGATFSFIILMCLMPTLECTQSEISTIGEYVLRMLGFLSLYNRAIELFVHIGKKKRQKCISIFLTKLKPLFFVLTHCGQKRALEPVHTGQQNNYYCIYNQIGRLLDCTLNEEKAEVRLLQDKVTVTWKFNQHQKHQQTLQVLLQMLPILPAVHLHY